MPDPRVLPTGQIAIYTVGADTTGDVPGNVYVCPDCQEEFRAHSRPAPGRKFRCVACRAVRQAAKDKARVRNRRKR